ncbi:MAG: hypothetical protein B6I24_08565 [Bacteroidetes bacterium 4572_128]|nr:MAG: hypothetical protein B6I24_08565 [Bacteroidetes bacterium 4572_128]
MFYFKNKFFPKMPKFLWFFIKKIFSKFAVFFIKKFFQKTSKILIFLKFKIKKFFFKIRPKF